MGFGSRDALINAITNNGTKFRADFNKNFNPTAAGVANEWHCLARGAGNPAADTIYNTGTNLAFQVVDDTVAGSGGIRHGGNVSPLTKHIISASMVSSAATSCPATFMVVDLLGFYRVTSVTTTTAQTLNNAVGLSRYTNGVGVQAIIWNTNATALGAATPTITLNYTNSDGTAGRVTPSAPSLPVGKSASSNGHIIYSGTGAGKYGPFVPLQQGDVGIRSIQSIQLSASYVSGEFSIALVRPLMTIPLAAIGVMTERDYVSQSPSLPQVVDGANLILLQQSGVATPANTSYYGHLEFGWN